MNIAIIHYHFRAGGVTRVATLAKEALEARGHRVVLVAGEKGPLGEIVAGLEYGAPACCAQQVVEGVEVVCQRKFGQRADVLHIHNHSLGKNSSLPLAVNEWAARGQPLVLQLHDFAENGRPENYARLRQELGSVERLYPWGEKILLVVLTKGAAARLEAAGAPAWVLPNPAQPLVQRKLLRLADLGAERLILYPTRAIRRKNIGEFFLHATRGCPGEIFAVSGAPGPGADRLVYEQWKRWLEGRGLAVMLDACGSLGCSLGDLLGVAAGAVTTSVEEGFGMAYVEPLAAGVPLAGRNLPEVTEDLQEAGLPLGNLYSRLPVPTHFCDYEGFLSRFGQQRAKALAAYGQAEDSEGWLRLWKEKRRQGWVDFGCLDEMAQREVLDRVPQWEWPDLEFTTPVQVAQARQVLTQNFGLQGYGCSLESLYACVLGAGSASVKWANAGRLLKDFLSLENFSALRGGV